jgi:hypothetical protein
VHQRHLFPLFPSFSRFSCKISAKESVLKLERHTLLFFKDNVTQNRILKRRVFTAGCQVFDKNGQFGKIQFVGEWSRYLVPTVIQDEVSLYTPGRNHREIPLPEDFG